MAAPCSLSSGADVTPVCTLAVELHGRTHGVRGGVLVLDRHEQAEMLGLRILRGRLRRC